MKGRIFFLITLFMHFIYFCLYHGFLQFCGVSVLFYCFFKIFLIEKVFYIYSFFPFRIVLFPVISLIQSFSSVRLFVTLWTSTPSFPVHHQLLDLAQIHVHRVKDGIQPSSHPLLSPLLLPSILPSIRVFSNESVLCIKWTKCWSFSFSISPSNEHSGLISFRLDWLALLAVQGTLKSLLQHHISKHQFFST